MQLAERLAEHSAFAPLMSFAGRVQALRPPPIPHRVGGFGGAGGLTVFLREHAYEAVIDATHPFAARISLNAAIACATEHRPLAVLTRPAWGAVDGDSWIDVETTTAAATALGTTPRRVFLAIGRQDLAAFRGGVAHRYVIRAVDPPDAATIPEDARVITARGPFHGDDELALLMSEKIDVVVSKNSGGQATYGKIAAARRLGLPVVMIQRPRAAVAGELHDPDAAMAWLEALRLRRDGVARETDHGAPP